MDYSTAGCVITHSSDPAALHAPVDGGLPPLSACASPGVLLGAGIVPTLLRAYVVALACQRFDLVARATPEPLPCRVVMLSCQRSDHDTR